MEEKLSEIINLVNAKDFTYKSKALELIQTLQNLEKKAETAETQLNAILLNFLIGNYTLYDFNFNLISKETKDYQTYTSLHMFHWDEWLIEGKGSHLFYQKFKLNEDKNVFELIDKPRDLTKQKTK